MEDASSLAVQALRHLSLKQILDIGFDRLPRDNRLYMAISHKLDKDIKLYYNIEGWSKFPNDLLFIINNEGKPIVFAHQLCIYWEKRGEEYIMVGNESCQDGPVTYKTLEETIGEVFKRILYTQNVPTNGVVNIIEKEKDEDSDIYEVLYHKRKELVDEFMSHLTKGGTIKINEPLKNLSFFPLTDTFEALILLNNDKLNLFGIKEHETYGWIATYAMQFSLKGIRRILAILAYNPGTYELLT